MRKNKKGLALIVTLSIACMIFGAAFGAPNDDSPAKLVKKIEFKAGIKYDGQVPEHYESLAVTMREKFPKATFKLDERTLMVGLPAVKADGFAIEHRSDCPVNSKFEVVGIPVLADVDTIKEILVAWTEDRHPHLRGNEVQSYTAPKGSKWYEYGEVVLKK